MDSIAGSTAGLEWRESTRYQRTVAISTPLDRSRIEGTGRGVAPEPNEPHRPARPRAEPLRPTGMRPGKIGCRRRTRLGKRQAVGRIVHRKPLERARVNGIQTVNMVARGDRKERRYRRICSCDARQTVQHGGVGDEHSAQQRAPREVDRDCVRQAVQFVRQRLRRRDDKARVRQTTALRRSGGTPRRLRHSGGVGVNTDHQGISARGGGGQHEASVTRTQVDDGPLVPRPERGNLADVYVNDRAAGDDAHDRSIERCSSRFREGVTPHPLCAKQLGSRRHRQV